MAFSSVDYWAGRYGEQTDYSGRVDVLPLSLVTAPTEALINAEEAKLHLRIDEDQYAEESWLDNAIDAATNYCQEEIMGSRQFVSATYELGVNAWWCGQLRIPRPPLSSVTWIKYYDANGTQQTLSSSIYTVRTATRQKGSVELAFNQTWPATDGRDFPITIRFVCGYGTASAVPKAIKQAVLLTLGWMYDQGRGGDDGKQGLDGAIRLLNTLGYGFYA